MEPDRKTLEIEVTAEHGERNSIFFTTLELPAIRGQIQDALQRLRTADQPEQHLDVSIRRCPLLPELIGIPLEAPTLWELNFFAMKPLEICHKASLKKTISLTFPFSRKKPCGKNTDAIFYTGVVRCR